jgi:hypothetical protein
MKLAVSSVLWSFNVRNVRAGRRDSLEPQAKESTRAHVILTSQFGKIRSREPTTLPQFAFEVI